MNSRSGRAVDRRTWWTQCVSGSSVRASSGHVAGHHPCCSRSASSRRVVGEPDPDGRDRPRAGATDRPATGRSCAGRGPPPPGCHSGRVGWSQRPRFSAQVSPPSWLSNRQPGSPPAYSTPVGLARDDHPDPLERLLAVLGERRPLGLLHSPAGSSVDPDPRAVEPRRDRREVAPRARIAHRVLDRLAGERPRRRPRTPSPTSPSSTNSPFFVPTRSSVISPSCDRGKHVHPVVVTDRRVLPRELTVDVDVHMAGGSHPRSSRIQPRTDGRSRSSVCSTSATRAAVDRVRAAAGELGERCAKEDERHRGILRPRAAARQDASGIELEHAVW